VIVPQTDQEVQILDVLPPQDRDQGRGGHHPQETALAVRHWDRLQMVFQCHSSHLLLIVAGMDADPCGSHQPEQRGPGGGRQEIHQAHESLEPPALIGTYSVSAAWKSPRKVRTHGASAVGRSCLWHAR
jgi:hypothetical protein